MLVPYLQHTILWYSIPNAHFLPGFQHPDILCNFLFLKKANKVYEVQKSFYLPKGEALVNEKSQYVFNN